MNKTSKYGFNIDYDALAIGFIDLLDSGEKAVLSFGMIPHDKFKVMMKSMWTGVSEKACAEGCKYEGVDPTLLEEALSKDFKREVEHEFSLAIYRNAKMVV